MREAVGGGVLRFAEQLLRRRERRRARRAGDLLTRHVGDAEVGEAPATIAVDQHVLRLEIAVHDPDRVRGGESAENEVDLRRDLGERARSRPRDQLGDRAALGELHRVPRHVAAAVPVEDRDDGRMRELRRELGLATKATDDALVARDVRVQQLERDLAAERQIADAPHGSERPGAERGEHFVVVGERPSQAHFGRFARVQRARLVAGEHEHRAAADDAIDRAKHRGQRRIPARRIRVQRAIDHGPHGLRRVGAEQLQRRHFVGRRILAREHREADRGELPLIAQRRRRPRCRSPTRCGMGMSRMSGHEARRDLVQRHCPLPADDPQPTHRRGPHRVGRHRAVRRAEVVQVAQRRADLAEHAQHAGNVVRAHAAQPRADGFARDPAAQIAGAAATLGERRPVVIRRGHRRMIAMREMPRLRFEPRVVRGIRRAHQRERAAERVDHFLIVAVLRVQSVGAPAPPRRKLPVAQMRRHLQGDAVHARLGFTHRR